jgi:hypothetical protein
MKQGELLRDSFLEIFCHEVFSMLKRYKRAGTTHPPLLPCCFPCFFPALFLSQVVRHLRGGVGIPEVSWVGTEGEANIMVQVSLSLSPLLPSRSPSLSLSLSRARALSLAFNC